MDHLGCDIKEIARRDDKGLDLKTLKPGVVLNVETHNSVYFIKLLNNKGEITIRGGTKQDGKPRFPSDIFAHFIGSHIPHQFLRIAWLGSEMCMDIQLNNGLISTSPVKNVIIEAEDQSWCYSLDWNK